jgi:formylmethanofuran dehydrogenase subunit C
LKDRITQQTILEGDGVYFNSVGGAAGTTWPIGTPEHPVNNETDLLVILTARNLDKVILRNSATVLQFTGALSDVIFIGEGEGGTLAPTVDFNGQAITCTFINLRITDTAGDNLVSASEFWNCDILKVIAHTVGGSNYYKCRFADGVTNPPLGIINLFNDCIGLGDFNNTTGSVFSYGDFHLAGSLINTTGLIAVHGNCTVRGLTNTAGEIDIYGNCQVTSIDQTDDGLIEISGRLEVLGASIGNSIGQISVSGDCSISQSITNINAGNISILGNLQVSHAISNTGTIGIKGNLQVGDDLTNSAGTITIGGIARIYGTITNTGTLTYKGVYPEVNVSINAINASETDFLNLAAIDGFHYTINKLRLKCADPGVNTVTVRLYELVNGALTQVDSFDIAAANFATYFSLDEMFGIEKLFGDNLQITVRASAGGPYAVTGEYAHQTA